MTVSKASFLCFALFAPVAIGCADDPGSNVYEPGSIVASGSNGSPVGTTGSTSGGSPVGSGGASTGTTASGSVGAEAGSGQGTTSQGAGTTTTTGTMGGAMVSTTGGGTGSGTNTSGSGVQTSSGDNTSAGGSSGGANAAGGGSDASGTSGGGATSSSGCGAAANPTPCSNSGSPCTMEVQGTTREFYVVLPSDYDSSQPYPVVFQFHPLGGNAEQGMNMYRIRDNFPDAIYVTPQGLGDTPGWANSNGEDVEFVRAMMADIEGQYCIDTSRYFSTGFSYGGIMSFTIVCQMADLFRAVAPMSGTNFGGSCNPARPIAAWITHGSEDTVVDPAGAATMRDVLLETNHCASTSVPVDPSPCVDYDGCDAGYPVTWCLVEGEGHAIPSFSSTAVAEFFQQF